MFKPRPLADGESSRRDVLTTFAMSFAGVGVLAAGWPLLSHLGPNASTPFPFVDLDVSNIKPREFRSMSLNGRPIHVRRMSFSSPWIVTQGNCVHCACRLKVFDDQPAPAAQALVCPCCASQFDFLGKRMAGPARSDLDAIPYTVLSNVVLRIGHAGCNSSAPRCDP